MSGATSAAGSRSGRSRGGLVVIGAALIVLGCMLVAAVAGLGAVPLSTGALEGAARQSPGVTEFARREIPPLYLGLYQRAAQRFGLDWAVLAGIGKVECDHGRDSDPSCSRSGAVNSAGAGGPMQFLGATWAAYGVDGDGDGRVDRWDSADAIFGAARYLRASGAPGDYHRAVLAYNRAEWYVAEVMRWAARYRAPKAASVERSASGDASGAGWSSPTPMRFVPGERAVLDPQDGRLALLPGDAPPAVQAMVVAGNELQQLPYGPGGHPDPRGAVEEDCSSTVNYVLYRSGLRPIHEIVVDNPLARDYIRWGSPGPGRWVTIYATARPTEHVFIVIAGLRLDTSHNGTDVGPNRNQDGPRWRVLDHIPTWGAWSIRHPPGM
ncbi:MAG TPA: lytic transglycosylase domain-containing protein [Solirubrobacteraceae bacterium]|nr:lytic transglycosylase domain-containing protein [Solirubrobacteraceae bacterium]